MSRTLSFDGQVVASPASMTVTVDGSQIFSGAVGAGAELDTDTTLATAEVAGAPDTESTVAVSIAVTAGIVRIGEVFADITNGAGLVGNGHRTNILINGVAPEWPGTVTWNGVEFTPKGTAENPDWTSWRFEVSAGETITFTATIDNKNNTNV